MTVDDYDDDKNSNMTVTDVENIDFRFRNIYTPAMHGFEF